MALAGSVLASVAPGCTLGGGQGWVTGTLNIPMCWSGQFNLYPNFFAAVPYMSTLDIRIQNGADFETFSDGVLILVDNVHEIRGDLIEDGGSARYPSELGQKLTLSLPPAVVPPDVPITPVSNPSHVHLSLYLNKSCQTEQIALYALDKVSLNPDGSCNPTDAGPLTIQCAPNNGLVDGGVDAMPLDGGADAMPRDAGVDATPRDGGSEGGTTLPTASSSLTFTALFDGNPYEANAAERLTQATFDAYLGDPRAGCAGGLGPPPPCLGHIKGSFSFYFQRGQPAQPFQ
jgi:hypothetical protein